MDAWQIKLRFCACNKQKCLRRSHKRRRTFRMLKGNMSCSTGLSKLKLDYIITTQRIHKHVRSLFSLLFTVSGVLRNKGWRGEELPSSTSHFPEQIEYKPNRSVLVTIVQYYFSTSKNIQRLLKLKDYGYADPYRI